MVTLETKAKKAYPDADPPTVDPFDANAMDRAVEPIRLDQETALCAETIGLVHETHSIQIKRQVVKKCLEGYEQTC